jgi:hypothetical protein
MNADIDDRDVLLLIAALALVCLLGCWMWRMLYDEWSAARYRRALREKTERDKLAERVFASSANTANSPPICSTSVLPSVS